MPTQKSPSPSERSRLTRRTDPEDITLVTPRFRLVFLSVLGLTTLLLMADVILAITVKNSTPQVSDLIDLCSRLATIGFGAIIGLLGGKAT